MPKYRNERYIRQIKNKNGLSFQVRFKSVRKTFNENDYGDSKISFNEAVKFRNELVSKNANYLMPYNKTIYDVMLESFETLVVRQKTRKNHISLFANHIKDKIQLRYFNENFVYSKLNDMVESCTDETISRVYNIFKRIDKTCLVKKYYDKSVMASVICPKSHLNSLQEFKEPISKEAVGILLIACSWSKNEFDREQLPLIVEFLYETGCRPCEVWCLTWDDISDSHISINKEVGSSNDDLNVVRTPKTPLSNRKLPITPKLRTVLEKAKNLSKNGLVFPNENGSMNETDLVGKKLKKLAKKVDIDFHLYDLRHRFATDLTLSHVDDRTKMELMGHKNISMTLDYARSNDLKKQEALENRQKMADFGKELAKDEN